jgi:hypothetical protein
MGDQQEQYQSRGKQMTPQLLQTTTGKQNAEIKNLYKNIYS